MATVERADERGPVRDSQVMVNCRSLKPPRRLHSGADFLLRRRALEVDFA